MIGIERANEARHPHPLFVRSHWAFAGAFQAVGYGRNALVGAGGGLVGGAAGAAAQSWVDTGSVDLSAVGRGAWGGVLGGAIGGAAFRGLSGAFRLNKTVNGESVAQGMGCELSTRTVVGFAARHAVVGGIGGMAGDAAVQGTELLFGLRGPGEHEGFSLRQMFAAGAGGAAGAALGYRVQRAMMRACFVAGTPVEWEFGSKGAEAFRAGDRVWSRDEHDPTGPVVLRVVEEVFERYARVLWVTVRGRVIGTTDEHPFHVAGAG